MNHENYVGKSLELHLFFGRIMKEHALFLQAGLSPVASCFAAKTECYKQEFEKLLSQAVSLSCNLIHKNVLDSGELITEFTQLAEKQTECLTGIAINKGITVRERKLIEGCCRDIQSDICRQIHRLNQRAIQLICGLIHLKEAMLDQVLNGSLFPINYPLLLEHIIREAKLYLRYVEMLGKEGILTDECMRQTECFWNQIMMEHAEFIRGLLDPSEQVLFCTANQFAEDYCELLKACDHAQRKVISTASLDLTMRFRDFKTAGVRGIEECKIRSIILPLLADHVLREANHYIRLLKE